MCACVLYDTKDAGVHDDNQADADGGVPKAFCPIGFGTRGGTVYKEREKKWEMMMVMMLG